MANDNSTPAAKRTARERNAASITDAVDADAPEIAAVLVASITELCVEDHQGDAEIIERWTANKTPDTIRTWIADPLQRLFVARENGVIVCVGAMSATSILLNYVAPDHRFRGHSKAMLSVLEACLALVGAKQLQLTSTKTAHKFYVSHGFVDDGPPQEAFGIPGQPMTKDLAAPSAPET